MPTFGTSMVLVAFDQSSSSCSLKLIKIIYNLSDFNAAAAEAGARGILVGKLDF